MLKQRWLLIFGVGALASSCWCAGTPLDELPNRQSWVDFWPADNGALRADGSIGWGESSLSCPSAESLEVWCGDEEGEVYDRHGESQPIGAGFVIDPHCDKSFRYEVRCERPDDPSEGAEVELVGASGATLGILALTAFEERELVIEQPERVYAPGESVRFDWRPDSDGDLMFDLDYFQDGVRIGTEAVRTYETGYRFTVPPETWTGELDVRADPGAIYLAPSLGVLACDGLEEHMCSANLFGVTARASLDVEE